MTPVPNDWRRRLRVALAAWLGGVLVRLLGATWRFTLRNREGVNRLRAERTPMIFAIWHGELLPLLWLHRREGVVVLISHHPDGEIIARMAESLGYGTIRGSTSHGGARAVLEMVRELEQGRDVAVTPDGPRGPRQVFAPGALTVAQRSRRPILVVRAITSHAWRLRSWDEFLIPKPFARISVRYGDSQLVTSATAREAETEATRFEALMARVGGEAGTDARP